MDLAQWKLGSGMRMAHRVVNKKAFFSTVGGTWVLQKVFCDSQKGPLTKLKGSQILCISFSSHVALKKKKHARGQSKVFYGFASKPVIKLRTQQPAPAGRREKPGRAGWAESLELESAPRPTPDTESPPPTERCQSPAEERTCYTDICTPVMNFFRSFGFVRKLGKGQGSASEENSQKNHESSRRTDDQTGACDFDTARPDEEDVACVSILVVGAGSRGKCYTYYAVNFPKRMKVVGVADPRSCTREDLKIIHSIDEDKLFEDWRDAAEKEKFADAVIIATPDKLHKDPAVAFAKKGYHILLEKPMAITPEDCCEIVSVCKESGVMLAVGHVMRYHPVSQKIKELIDSGAIGDVVHIQHMEPVGHWHFAHSYVRGNWRNEEESTFSLLAKSCHDIDLICYWMGAKRCVKVSSFGALCHFTKENKPKGAASRCLDCSVEKSCPYSAERIYLKKGKEGIFGWPVSVVCSNGVYDVESLTEALRTGPYGRCVYECDNDVVTNQVVNMEFDGGVTAAFTMMAFTHALGARTTTIYGSKGEIRCKGSEPIEVFDFVARKTDKHLASKPAFIPLHLMAHGGADYFLIHSFISAVAKNDSSLIQTGPEDTLRSHLLVFEAERSRRESCVIHLDH
ncbi:uncharacterized protein RCH25_044403 [Pelodytes ibericus]